LIRDMESGSPPPEQPPPTGPQAPPPAAPAYTPIPGGPETPPSGWQQPIPAAQGWEGRPLASWGSRVGATLLDWLILVVPVTVLIVVVVVIALNSTAGGIVTGILAGLAYLVALLLYAPLLMGREGEHNGQTWGKQIVGIRVVRDTGQPVDVAFGFLREFVVKGLLFGFAGSFFFSIPTLVDYLWPLWEDENRCLHDLLVKTHVVKG
jgi:uncharacterized RDD family membrane protein YckC